MSFVLFFCYICSYKMIICFTFSLMICMPFSPYNFAIPCMNILLMYSIGLLLKLIAYRWTPYGNTKCIICKQQVHQDAKYCHTCAYSKGVCAMCGKQVLDTKFYKQSNV
ncbi:hypothetical protein Ahy_B09g100068 isoform B [Arachis hypogaea]|uniref:Cysteine-rich PDZ-binding protein n=1 Tax=Arachis hypogaea TaxID=3818 RepID=A0A444XVL1_ARAHY|nr:hypothetical protein Ahy_B09g100068 isoform B [Arachis hypogaea]